ncbi:hypothetical protein FOA52_011363 [Chlamydomonas sp. UWO 241]|nr:hypothetical protein FOA52_011363 [Chlamydomonas sp. UWO 241]
MPIALNRHSVHSSSRRAFGGARAAPAAKRPTRLASSANSLAVQQASADRRALLLGGASLGLSALLRQAAPAQAGGAESGPSVYNDAADNFSIAIPEGWANGEGVMNGNSGYMGASGLRRTVAWFPDDPSVRDVNISIVITNVSVEFTKLGSFGNVSTFAGNLVNSLDRSFLSKDRNRTADSDPVQIANLVDYNVGKSGESYDVEYTVQKLPGPQRHLFSTVMLGSNGKYNRLYTVTAQCMEEDLPKYKDVLQASCESFRARFSANLV